MANPSIEALAALITDNQPLAILTGAGISTDSGIPDYRGVGTSIRTPMNISEFTHDLDYRRRFWAGASVNAQDSGHIDPNPGHLALAALERAGIAHGVITQNVDNLHFEAGSQTVVELHGNGNNVRCMQCGNRFTRYEVTDWFNRANPGYVASQLHAETAPDGDALVTGFAELIVPVCPICTGILRPEIVYFGETVPVDVFARAEALVGAAGALLIVGSSLAVNTGIRLLHRAERRSIPIAVINRGPTGADTRAQLRYEAGASETLTQLLSLLHVDGL